MFAKAKEVRDGGVETVTKWEEVMPALNSRKLLLAPWCGEVRRVLSALVRVAFRDI